MTQVRNLKLYNPILLLARGCLTAYSLTVPPLPGMRYRAIIYIGLKKPLDPINEPRGSHYCSLIETSSMSNFGDPTFNRSSDLRLLLTWVNTAMIPAAKIITSKMPRIIICRESLTINTSQLSLIIFHATSLWGFAVLTQKNTAINK